jgi:hypothetical protein
VGDVSARKLITPYSPMGVRGRHDQSVRVV